MHIIKMTEIKIGYLTWLFTPWIPTTGRQRQVGLFEIEGSIVYTVFQKKKKTSKQAKNKTIENQAIYMKVKISL